MGERMISACVVPTVKHGGGDVIVWGCFAGDTVCDIVKIEGTLNEHSSPIGHATWFVLSGTINCFQQDNDPTPLQAV